VDNIYYLGAGMGELSNPMMGAFFGEAQATTKRLALHHLVEQAGFKQ
jgi:hypothetical protein